MPIVIQLPEVKREKNERPQRCPHCKGETFQRWGRVKKQIRTIVEELPPGGGRQLLAFYKQLPGQLRHGQERTAEGELRQLLIRLSDYWERYTAFFQDPGLPWTNNRTEQAIGRMKMRAKSTRGYKTKRGMLNGLLISSASMS